MPKDSNRVYVEMAEEPQDYSRISYHLAKSISCYLTAVVVVESGKMQGQRLELSDNEIYAANIMLLIAANKISLDYQLNASVVYSLAFEEFWNGIYCDEHIKSCQNEMNASYNGLLVNSRDTVETVGNLFSELGQHDDLKSVKELADIYHSWVKYLTSLTMELN
mgnify:FL=1